MDNNSLNEETFETHVPGASSATNQPRNSNSFSIDSILSTNLASAQQQQSVAMSLMNKIQDQTAPRPNFLYFMACLLQQQQQQQHLQQQMQQHQNIQRQRQHQQLQHQHQQQQQPLQRRNLSPQQANQPSRQHTLSGHNGHIRHQQQQALSHLSPTPKSPSSRITSGKLDTTGNKPAHSYIGLIGMCILSSPEKRMVLSDIYQFILDNYSYYRNRGSGWRNSVRHNLSLNECFQKAGRAANGKGHYWTIHPANMEDFMAGDFRRRRAQRKVRRWNNMDVPSDESEEEDATKPPLPDHFKRSIEMHRRIQMMSYQKSAQERAAALSMANAAAAAVAVATNQSRVSGAPTFSLQ